MVWLSRTLFIHFTRASDQMQVLHNLFVMGPQLVGYLAGLDTGSTAPGKIPPMGVGPPLSLRGDYRLSCYGLGSWSLVKCNVIISHGAEVLLP